MIVSADDDLNQRLETIARDGPVPREQHDDRLVRSGLVKSTGVGDLMQVRAPVFADLAQAG